GALVAGEEPRVPVLHQEDLAGVKVGVVLVLTAPAPLAPRGGDALGRPAAAGAEAAGALPVERLHGHAAEREEVVGQPRALHRDERLPLEPRGQGGVGAEARHPARRPAEEPEAERDPGGAAEAARELALGQPQLAAVRRDEERLVLDQEPASPRLDRRRGLLGGDEGGAQALPVEREIDGEGCRLGHGRTRSAIVRWSLAPSQPGGDDAPAGSAPSEG